MTHTIITPDENGVSDHTANANDFILVYYTVDLRYLDHGQKWAVRQYTGRDITIETFSSAIEMDARIAELGIDTE